MLRLSSKYWLIILVVINTSYAGMPPESQQQEKKEQELKQRRAERIKRIMRRARLSQERITVVQLQPTPQPPLQ